MCRAGRSYGALCVRRLEVVRNRLPTRSSNNEKPMEDKNVTETGLELDKLDIPSGTMRPGENTPFPPAQDKGKVSDRKEPKH